MDFPGVLTVGRDDPKIVERASTRCALGIRIAGDMPFLGLDDDQFTARVPGRLSDVLIRQEAVRLKSGFRLRRMSILSRAAIRHTFWRTMST
jgi:hypothetical protein